MAWPRLELDLTAGGGAAPKPRVGSPAFGKRGAVLIAATPGLASAADAVVVVENGHDRDATASTGLLQLKSPAKSVRQLGKPSVSRPYVDRIVQRQHGGSDDPPNLRLRCFSCSTPPAARTRAEGGGGVASKQLPVGTTTPRGFARKTCRSGPAEETIQDGRSHERSHIVFCTRTVYRALWRVPGGRSPSGP
jgi:hypothetical protein